MLCDEVRPMLIRHLEGRLRADEEQCFERHLEQCNMCQEALEIQQRVAEVFARPDAPSVQSDKLQTPSTQSRQQST